MPVGLLDVDVAIGPVVGVVSAAIVGKGEGGEEEKGDEGEKGANSRCHCLVIRYYEAHRRLQIV